MSTSRRDRILANIRHCLDERPDLEEGRIGSVTICLVFNPRNQLVDHVDVNVGRRYDPAPEGVVLRERERNGQ